MSFALIDNFTDIHSTNGIGLHNNIHSSNGVGLHTDIHSTNRIGLHEKKLNGEIPVTKEDLDELVKSLGRE